MSRVDAILARLADLYPRAIDLSLDRVRRLMHRLGDPQDRLPPVVHIAGTNGKGSTIAILRACLEAAGYAVHVYTSPHLVRFAERIRLAGALIGEEPLSDLLDEVERRNAGEPITLFEVTTAAAFLAFSRMPADILLLETGLGGRLDATNVVAAPAFAGITPISLDHMSFLGSTLGAIAGEKAGILKPGRPALLSRQPAEAADIIRRRAREIGAPIFAQDEDWTARPSNEGWRYEDADGALDLPLPSLPGRHQIDNAGLAMAGLRRLDGFRIGPDAMAKGLRRIDWPARMQRLDKGPLVAAVGSGWEVWLDGAHNPGGAAALAEFIRSWSDRPLHLVLGLLSNRDPADVAAPLAAQLASVETVTIPGEANSLSAEECAARLVPLGIAARPAASVLAAVAAIRQREGGQGARILICGSLYLAGHVLAELAGGTGMGDAE